MILKALFSILLAISWLKVANSQNILMNFLNFLNNGQFEMNMENLDDEVKLRKEYDFIVVGAGTAGCALAARLSENPEWKVLLLEAGGPETMIMDIPILAHFLQLTEINWGYKTEPSKSYCLGLNDNRCNWPRGKVMGGSSVLNYMMYTRGNRKDYDRWSELGNEGWSFKDVEPYFQKYEGNVVANAEKGSMGTDGPVRISHSPWKSKVCEAFVEACQQNGSKYRDYNGRIQNGVSYLQSTTYQGIRWSSNRAYLYPLKGKRKNLHIRKKAMVIKILIDEQTKEAKGIVFSMKGKSYEVRAGKEVILTAGAINTPQLMMLSGLGPAQHLKEIGIKPLVDLAVGYNLIDHFATAITVTANTPTLVNKDFFNVRNMNLYFQQKGGIFTIPGGVEAIAFWDLDNEQLDDSWPNLEIFLVGGLLDENKATFNAFGFKPAVYRDVFAPPQNNVTSGFMLFPMILRPKSRGRLLLKSKDPFKFPKIYANYMADLDDLDVVVRGVLKALQIVEMPAMKAIGAKLLNTVLKPCAKHGFGSRKYWECYIRYFTFTIYHYSGTAKMGPANDSTAVVDPRLRVYGVKNLRVADASIMPELIAGHPNGPVFMIAEKAADMIKADYNYK